MKFYSLAKSKKWERTSRNGVEVINLPDKYLKKYEALQGDVFFIGTADLVTLRANGDVKRSGKVVLVTGCHIIVCSSDTGAVNRFAELSEVHAVHLDEIDGTLAVEDPSQKYDVFLEVSEGDEVHEALIAAKQVGKHSFRIAREPFQLSDFRIKGAKRKAERDQEMEIKPGMEQESTPEQPLPTVDVPMTQHIYPSLQFDWSQGTAAELIAYLEKSANEKKHDLNFMESVNDLLSSFEHEGGRLESQRRSLVSLMSVEVKMMNKIESDKWKEFDSEVDSLGAQTKDIKELISELIKMHEEKTQYARELGSSISELLLLNDSAARQIHLCGREIAFRKRMHVATQCTARAGARAISSMLGPAGRPQRGPIPPEMRPPPPTLTISNTLENDSFNEAHLNKIVALHGDSKHVVGCLLNTMHNQSIGCRMKFDGFKQLETAVKNTFSMLRDLLQASQDVVQYAKPSKSNEDTVAAQAQVRREQARFLESQRWGLAFLRQRAELWRARVWEVDCMLTNLERRHSELDARRLELIREGAGAQQSLSALQRQDSEYTALVEKWAKGLLDRSDCIKKYEEFRKRHRLLCSLYEKDMMLSHERDAGEGHVQEDKAQQFDAPVPECCPRSATTSPTIEEPRWQEITLARNYVPFVSPPTVEDNFTQTGIIREGGTQDAAAMPSSVFLSFMAMKHMRVERDRAYKRYADVIKENEDLRRDNVFLTNRLAQLNQRVDAILKGKIELEVTTEAEVFSKSREEVDQLEQKLRRSESAVAELQGVIEGMTGEVCSFCLRPRNWSEMLSDREAKMIKRRGRVISNEFDDEDGSDLSLASELSEELSCTEELLDNVGVRLYKKGLKFKKRREANLIRKRNSRAQLDLIEMRSAPKTVFNSPYANERLLSLSFEERQQVRDAQHEARTRDLIESLEEEERRQCAPVAPNATSVRLVERALRDTKEKENNMIFKGPTADWDERWLRYCVPRLTDVTNVNAPSNPLPSPRRANSPARESSLYTPRRETVPEEVTPRLLRAEKEMHEIFERVVVNGKKSKEKRARRIRDHIEEECSQQFSPLLDDTSVKLVSEKGPRGAAHHRLCRPKASYRPKEEKRVDLLDEILHTPREEQPKPKPRLTEEFMERQNYLLASQRKRLRDAKAKVDEEETRECIFSPSISKRSSEIIEEKYGSVMRAERMDAQRERLLRESLRKVKEENLSLVEVGDADAILLKINESLGAPPRASRTRSHAKSPAPPVDEREVSQTFGRSTTNDEAIGQASEQRLQKERALERVRQQCTGYSTPSAIPLREPVKDASRVPTPIGGLFSMHDTGATKGYNPDPYYVMTSNIQKHFYRDSASPGTPRLTELPQDIASILQPDIDILPIVNSLANDFLEAM